MDTGVTAISRRTPPTPPPTSHPTRSSPRLSHLPPRPHPLRPTIVGSMSTPSDKMENRSPVCYRRVHVQNRTVARKNARQFHVIVPQTPGHDSRIQQSDCILAGFPRKESSVTVKTQLTQCISSPSGETAKQGSLCVYVYAFV